MAGYVKTVTQVISQASGCGHPVTNLTLCTTGALLFTF